VIVLAEVLEAIPEQHRNDWYGLEFRFP